MNNAMSEKIIVPIIMILSGAGIVVIWTHDILKGKLIDMSRGFFRQEIFY